MKANNRKGSTLLELTIVMAILAIISVLCVSFAELAKNYTLSITTDEVVLSDFDDIKRVFDTWTNNVDFDGSEITISGVNNDKIVASYNLTQYSLQLGFIDGVVAFYGSCPSLDENVTKQIVYVGTGRISSIMFKSIKNSSNGEYLLSLTVEYTYYEANGEKNDERSGSKTFLKTLRSAVVSEGSV